MPLRVPRLFGSALTLFGAFAVGGVLHAVLVEGSLTLLSPAAVLGVAAGVALLLAGRRLEGAFDPSAYVPGSDGDDGDEEYAEEFSPVDADALEGRDADDSYRDP